MSKKTKRDQKRKKWKTLNEAFKATQKKKGSAARLSFCFEHGPYTADNLCPCYDKGGQYEGETYGEQPVSETWQEALFCPIHGEVPSSEVHGGFSCDCYDADGNLKPDWDKDLE